jgi:hypothetical protein
MTTEFIIVVDQTYYLFNQSIPPTISDVGSLKYFPLVNAVSTTFNPLPQFTLFNTNSKNILPNQINTFFSGTQVGKPNPTSESFVSGLVIQNNQNILLLDHSFQSLNQGNDNVTFGIDRYKLQVGSRKVNIDFVVQITAADDYPDIKEILKNVNQNELYYMYVQINPNILTQISDLTPTNGNSFKYYTGPYNNIQLDSLYWNTLLITNNLVDVPQISQNKIATIEYNLFPTEDLNNPKQNAMSYNISLYNTEEFPPSHFVN